MQKKDIIIHLEEEMQKINISKEDASRMIGCSLSQLYRWINRVSKPSCLSRNAIDRAIKKMRRMAPVVTIEMAEKDRSLYRKLKKKISIQEKKALLDHADNYPDYQKELRKLAKKHNITE